MSKVTYSPGVNPTIQSPVAEELKRFADTVGDLIVTSALRPGDTGEHGRGLAVDVIAPGYAGRLLDLYLSAERGLWKGIGVYPAWQLNGKVVGGLHLDLRAGPAARWLGTGSGKNQLYLALSQENLKKFGVT
jgi:hypothetical protein